MQLQIQSTSTAGFRKSKPIRITYDITIYEHTLALCGDVNFRGLDFNTMVSVMKVWEPLGHMLLINQNRYCECTTCMREHSIMEMYPDAWGGKAVCNWCAEHVFGWEVFV